MKAYLAAVIQEQIHRGLKLKQMVPHPLQYAELNSLAVLCSMIIDQNIERLRWLLQELQNRSEDDIRDIFRGFRDSAEQIQLVEYYGISPLYHQNPEIGYLTKLVYKIHQEINLPLTPPVVTCIATKYYHFHPFTNVILVPIGEPHFLLHLPDLFHEVGHEVLWHTEKEPNLQQIAKSYSEAIHQITKTYNGLLIAKKRETGPRDTIRLINLIHHQWKSWINEFFCDLFALFTLGPAYAWSHLHLTLKLSKNIYQFSTILPQTHPSDDARMKLLTKALHKLGFSNQTEKIASKWQSLPIATATRPVPEYQYAYPDDLLDTICSIFLNGIEKSGFSIVTQKCLKHLRDGSVVLLLNEAWENFWSDSNGFREWEEDAINRLKSSFLPSGQYSQESFLELSKIIQV